MEESCQYEEFSNVAKILIMHLQLSNDDVSLMLKRSCQSEVLLLVLRFFNVVMSRKRVRYDKVTVSINA